MTCAATNCTRPANVRGDGHAGSTLCRQHERRVLEATTWRERRAVLREMGDVEGWR